MEGDSVELWELTIEVWSGKGLDDGEAEEEVAGGDPAFGNDVSRRESCIRKI